MRKRCTKRKLNEKEKPTGAKSTEAEKSRMLLATVCRAAAYVQSMPRCFLGCLGFRTFWVCRLADLWA